jgi:hypothetical protein
MVRQGGVRTIRVCLVRAGGFRQAQLSERSGTRTPGAMMPVTSAREQRRPRQDDPARAKAVLTAGGWRPALAAVWLFSSDQPA